MGIARAGGTLRQVGNYWMPTAHSGEWQSGMVRAGLNTGQIKEIADYWDEHDYFKSITSFADQDLIKAPLSHRRITKSNNPIGYYADSTRNKKYENTIDFTTEITQRTDPFKKLRSGYTVDGDVATRDGVTGRVLNNAFISDEAYENLSDTEREFYGKTFSDVTKEDPVLGFANKAIQTGIGYRSAANSKGGLAKKVGSVLAPAISIAGALTGNPAIAAFGGAVGGAQAGGNIGSILAGGALGYFGVKGAKALNFGQTGSIWDAAGGGVNPLGAANSIQTAGGNSVGWLSNIFSAGKNVLGDVGGLLGKGLDLAGSTGVLDFLKGNAGNILTSGIDYYTAGKTADAVQDAARTGAATQDPFSAYRGKYAGLLDQHMTNPGSVFDMDPSARFRYELGQESLQRTLNASGNRLSGRAATDAIKYGSEFASTEYQRQFERLGALSGASASGFINAGSTLASGLQTSAGQYGDRAGAVGTFIGNVLTKGRSSPTSSNKLDLNIPSPVTYAGSSVNPWEYDDGTYKG